eukprot:g40553.t1
MIVRPWRLLSLSDYVEMELEDGSHIDPIIFVQTFTEYQYVLIYAYLSLKVLSLFNHLLLSYRIQSAPQGISRPNMSDKRESSKIDRSDKTVDSDKLKKTTIKEALQSMMKKRKSTSQNPDAEMKKAGMDRDLTPDEQNMTHKQLKKARADEMERRDEERTRRRWERNYSSNDTVLDEKRVEVYYCAFCGAFALMMDVSLRKLPLRKTDSSRVLEEQKHTFKRNMVMGPTVHIKRRKGVERQYRLNCKACGLLMCYRVAPVGKPSKYCYFVKDALVGDPSEVVTSIDESSFPGALVSTSNSSQAEALFPSGGPSSASSSD